MIKNKYSVIGVMSGTSLDGIDLVHVTFNMEEVWTFKIHAAETIRYTTSWFQKLKKLTDHSLEHLRNLDNEYTLYLGTEINRFINKHQISNLDAVCSHGHTALHRPDEKLTFQIGNLPKLAKILNEKVVCDFRVEDVEHGGQGAPLVPIGDKLLFSDYDFCLNLGGFANISMDVNEERIAYDLCPVNIVLNHYMNAIGEDFDNRGQVASQGTIDQALLRHLNQLDFYQQPPPKSLGLEWVQGTIFPLMDSISLNVQDRLRTFVEHIAIQISKGINTKSVRTGLVTGGGSYHDFLISRIEYHTNKTIVLPNDALINFKEAMVFGFLGVLKLRNEVNCLKSVTGASKNHSSGKIYCP